MIEIAIILSKVVESFIDALTGKLTDKLWTKLQGDPAKNAIKQALGSAIQMYAGQNFRLELAQPLLQENGPLTEPEVAQELTQIICFQHEPNYNLIGQRWRLSMENPPPWSNFTDEAKRLLEYFRDVLRETDVFRPVFDSKSLDAIAANATTSARSLTNIERQLTELKSLMASHFEELSRYFATAVPDIRNEILDYTGYIGEKTQGFVGRQFVFDAVTNFTEEYPRGYFIIHGNSGLGLTALAAEMVRTNGYVHHFNVRIQGICTAEAFLRNVCAQLIVRYKLNYSSLPDKATLDGGFLSQLLAEVSGTLGTNEKAIIVISALDDVDTQSLSPGTNILYLPSSLPKGIYIIGTGRVAGSHMKIACEYSDLFIGKDYPENIADVKEYIKRAIKLPGIQAYIEAQGIDNELFIEHLIEKSEGNFLYLHYVLPEIERGTYKDLELSVLPTGVMNLYEDHWERMRGKDQLSWFEYKLPILMALTVLQRPVFIDEIGDLSGIGQRAYIRDILKEWEPYVPVKLAEHQGELQKCYSLYSRGFYHFVKNQEAIKDERDTRKEALKKLSDQS